MISALAWVPRGAAKAVPEPAEWSPEEISAAKLAALEEREESEGEETTSSEDGEEMDAAAEVAKAKAFAAALKSSSGGGAPAVEDVDAAMAELDMDNYDEEEEEGGGVRGVFGNSNPGMAYYRTNDEDPYIKLAAVKDVDSEADDFEIKGDDFLILAARNEDDVSHLEVWVYEEADEVGGPSNIYVHHDILLPAFPLSVAWMDCGPAGRSNTGNFAAVGTMNPGIELWDLDVVDSVEPVAVLGGELPGLSAVDAADGEADAGEGSKKKKKSKSKRKASKPLKEGSHSDAVLGLSWNSEYRNVLASSSADNTVKVWDVATQQCEHTLSWHSDKVQAVAWNPAEAPVLLSGGFDKQVVLGDVRTPDGNPLRWEVSADIEALTWDPHNPTCFLASSEDGIVAAFDARAGAGGAPLYRLSAHDKPTCCLSFCPAARGLLATGSTDSQVKLWDVSDKPSLLAAQDLKVGPVFAASFSREQPSLLAAGGAKGTVAVWDILTSAAIASKYGKSLVQGRAAQAAVEMAVA